MKIATQKFHDIDVRFAWVPRWRWGWKTTTTHKHLAVKEREVGYRFYTHFHPYVGAFAQRLIRKSVQGLEAIDTEYERNADGTFAVLANSVRVLMADGVAVKLPDGVAVKLGKDTAVPGAVVRLPGANLGTTPNGLRLQRSNGPSVDVLSGQAISVVNEITVLRPDGEPVKLDSSATLTLLDSRPKPTLFAELFSSQQYDPNADVVDPRYPVQDVDFTSSGAYSVYNWELFYHLPLSVAIQLSKNQRFQEAQRWFHYVFDPTDDSDGPTPERFWRVKPFQSTDVKKVEEILINLATGEDKALQEETVNCIGAWKENPFRPHVIARYRQSAYMLKTVMAYLDNLVAWGDSLFRQDTGEAIDEALQLYVLAANILGPRPQAVPTKGSIKPQTYATLKNKLHEAWSAMVDLEPAIAFDLVPHPGTESDDEGLAVIRSVGQTLYFCVPRNDQLLGYWDTVADRLFKIRNSLNIQGVFRQLALFEPPIDPGLLARAAAAGLDVGAVISGLNQPLPLVRFQLLVQKASEICQEVKSLGNNLLSATEKEDGEAMALLRAKHERVVMEMVEHVKYGQLQEAIKSREGLLQTLALAVQRYTFYERQLGKKPDEIGKAIPVLSDLDKDSLDKMKFAMEEQGVNLREIEVDIAADAAAKAAQALSGGKLLSSYEVRETLLLEGAQLSADIANILNVVSSASHYVPDFTINVQPMGAGSSVAYGGRNVGDAVGATAAAARAVADRLNFEARRAARIDGFARRERDWAFQSNLAVGEMTQIFKQLRAAQIREAIAEQELKSHRQQMKHAEEIEGFLKGENTTIGDQNYRKTTTQGFYTWLKREVKGLYSQCFQFAFDIAKKAERALQHEFGKPELSYLQFGYLAGKEGLLAGEKLYLDVKRMEMAYHDQNQREYELTKHVSLLQVDPLALIRLRTTGHCTVRLPESLFDMDGPGHYFRRIKTVAVSIPCVIGPYASVNCTLTLLKSSIRRTPVVGEQYARADAEDDRFSDYFGSLQSIVTSSTQNDSGLFETNLRDERYLPFENSGVISEWQLQLPADPSKKDPAQFDYDTISDVILHLRYTAREGGNLLRSGALANLKTAIDEATAAGSVRLFSVRSEFPSEWAKFLSQTPGADHRYELSLTFRPEHYPFWSKSRLNSVTRLDILARSTEAQVPASLNVYDQFNDQPQAAQKDTLVKAADLDNLLVGKLTGGAASGIALPAKPEGELKLYFDNAKLSDLWIAVTWTD